MKPNFGCQYISRGGYGNSFRYKLNQQISKVSMHKLSFINIKIEQPYSKYIWNEALELFRESIRIFLFGKLFFWVIIRNWFFIWKIGFSRLGQVIVLSNGRENVFCFKNSFLRGKYNFFLIFVENIFWAETFLYDCASSLHYKQLKEALHVSADVNLILDNAVQSKTGLTLYI